MKQIIIILTLISVITYSCKKLDLNKISTAGTWNPNIAVPLAFGEFDVYDILARTDSSDLVVIDEQTGKLALVYSGEYLAVQAKDILELGDYSDGYNVDAGDLSISSSPSFTGSANESFNETFSVNPGGGNEIHAVIFNQGQLRVTVNSTFNHNVNVTVVFPGMIKNGSPVTFDFTLSGSSNDVNTINLSGVEFDLSMGGSSFNTFEVETEMSVSGTGGAISGNESVDIDFEMQNIDYTSVFGYFGQLEKPFKDSIQIKIFNQVIDGTFKFTDPKVNMEIMNSFGIPMNIELDELKTIVEETGQEIPLQGYPSPVNINKPATPGDVSTTLINLDKSNTSNMESIVAPAPRYFYYDSKINLNPSGPSSDLNFIKNSSELVVRGEIELPLKGYAYGFSIRDTFDFNVGDDLEDADAIEYVMFRLNIDNGFPVDVDGQVIFLDENHNPVFSAFDDQEDLAVSALTDNSGKVTESTKKITDILLERDEIELLNQVKYFELIGFGETKNGTQEEIVRIFDEYKIKLRLGVQIEAKQSF